MNQEKQKAVRALKTARGQIDGIIKMIEDERYCVDVSNQILAAQSLLKSANMLILKQHMAHCVKEACQADHGEGGADEKINEVMAILEKMISK